MLDRLDPTHQYPKVELAVLSASVLEALAASSIDRANVAFGRELPPSLLEHSSLWAYRVAQARENPQIISWLVRVVIDVETREIVGHAGFHGPPDERGMVEIGYSIEPPFRRRGYARATAAALIDYAAGDPEVSTVRASISPDNAASLATIRPFGFVRVGEQMDEIDGLEYIFELTLRGDTVGVER